MRYSILIIIFICSCSSNNHHIDLDFIEKNICAKLPKDFVIVESGAVGWDGNEPFNVFKFNKIEECTRFENAIKTNICNGLDYLSDSTCGCWTVQNDTFTFHASDVQFQSRRFILMEYYRNEQKARITEAKV